MTGMNTRTKLLFQLATLFAVMGASAPVMAVSSYTVQLKINDDQTMLEATTRGRCARNDQKGCLRVKKNRTARFNFVLKGDTSCNRPGGYRWNLGGVYLGGKGSETKTGTWGSLDTEVQEDFSVANAASGLLNKASGSNQGKIVITDQNQHKYDIWYKVTANCVDMSGQTIATIEMDPRIENDGFD